MNGKFVDVIASSTKFFGKVLPVTLGHILYLQLCSTGQSMNVITPT